MNLKLNKPIVFFDIESTGLDISKDRIVEISITKIHPDGKKEIKTRRVNPTVPIPIETSKIHGIYDKDVAEEATFKSIAKSLSNFIGNSDLAGYNSNKFDVPLLVEEFLRADVDFDFKKRKLVDVQNVFHKMESRTLVAAYSFYCEKELVNAHSANADVEATYDVLEAILNRSEKLKGEASLLKSLLSKTDNKEEKTQLNTMIEAAERNAAQYETISNDVEFLSTFSERHKTADLMGRLIYNSKNEIVFNFGKYKGQLVSEVLKNNLGYYDWMMKGDFPEYTKKILTNIKLNLLK